MKKQNEKKLLGGVNLGEEIDLTVRSLAQFMAEEGVVVTPFVGRMRCNIPLPNFGVHTDQMSVTGSRFYAENAGKGFLRFIPKADELELIRLESKLRRACEERVLADAFMPVSAYRSLQEEFSWIRQAYFEKGDEILTRWEELTQTFKNGVEEMLEGVDLGAEEKEQVKEAILSKIPEKESYKNSLQMRLKIRAFQGELRETNFEGDLSNNLTESWREDVVSTAVHSIEKQVEEGWNWVMKGLRRYLKELPIGTRVIEGLTDFREALKWKNVFSNPLLKELETMLAGLEQAADDAKKAYTMEQAAVAIWRYSKEANIVLPMEEIPYTEEMLDQMLLARA